MYYYMNNGNVVILYRAEFSSVNKKVKYGGGRASLFRWFLRMKNKIY